MLLIQTDTNTVTAVVIVAVSHITVTIIIIVNATGMLQELYTVQRIKSTQ